MPVFHPSFFSCPPPPLLSFFPFFFLSGGVRITHNNLIKYIYWIHGFFVGRNMSQIGDERKSLFAYFSKRRFMSSAYTLSRNFRYGCIPYIMFIINLGHCLPIIQISLWLVAALARSLKLQILKRPENRLGPQQMLSE